MVPALAAVMLMAKRTRGPFGVLNNKEADQRRRTVHWQRTAPDKVPSGQDSTRTNTNPNASTSYRTKPVRDPRPVLKLLPEDASMASSDARDDYLSATKAR